MNATTKITLLLSALLVSGCTACAPPSGESASPAATPVLSETGLLVETPAGATRGDFDVHDPITHEVVTGYQHPNQVVPLPAGHYTITAFLNSEFVWARDVSVTPGVVTHIAMGAIRVNTVAGTHDGRYSLADANADGNTLLDSDEPNTIVTVPPGAWRIADYMSSDFVWAPSLAVHAGAISELKLGAMILHTPDGCADQYFSVFDPSKGRFLQGLEPLNTVVSAPAGALTLTRYLTSSMVHADSLPIVEGQISEVTLGAIRWNNAEGVTVMDAGGTKVLTEGLEPGMQMPARAGGYLLKFFGSHAPVPVSVMSGAVTDAS